MIIKCKVAAGECPQELDICCATCGFKENCGNVCGCPNSMKDPQNCPDAEVITGEMTAFQSAVPDTIGKITTLIKMKKQLEDQEKQLKQKLVEAMEIYGVKSFENDLIKMTYVAPTTRTTVDSAKLKKFYPEEYEACAKTSPVSASVRVTLKG